ncbi:porin [Thioclava sp. A2]|uniref:porin n=1 Tax=Thioclava sp. FCG-A2 TaxID=3080562 RepID=UPI0029556229|nr:porin [Thioclava sp. A2]MDV7272024.1 porin [Thioclava sp. A2]
MKKVLFATTALVLSAGFASAEITMSGSANMGIKHAENGLSWADGDGNAATRGKDTAGWYEIDIDVVGTTETDSGLTFGARIQLDSDYSTVLNTAGTDINGNVFVSGAFGTFNIGSGLDPVSDDDTLSDIGLDGIGTDNVAETFAYKGAADARWDYSVGALTLGASVHTIQEDYAVKVGYDFGTAAIAVAYDHDEASDTDTVQAKLSGSMGAVSGQIFYATSDSSTTAANDGDSYGVYAAYKTGALTLSASYADADGLADAAYGIGAAYDLGGATLAGGIGSVNDETVADFGVSFKF